MSSRTRRALNLQPGPIMTLSGGIIAIASYFAPWIYTYIPGPLPPTGLRGFTGWDIASRVFLSPTPTQFARQIQLNPAVAPSVFIMLALPFIMAALALIFTGIGFFKSAGFLRGLNIAATQVGFFALFGEALYAFLLAYTPYGSPTIVYPIGIGFPLEFLGYFLLIAGAITHAMSGRAAPAESSIPSALV